MLLVAGVLLCTSLLINGMQYFLATDCPLRLCARRIDSCYANLTATMMLSDGPGDTIASCVEVGITSSFLQAFEGSCKAPESMCGAERTISRLMREILHPMRSFRL
jgi:hypothetical protein